jgi:serine/threonine protein kinase
MTGEKKDKGGKRIKHFGRFEILAHIATGGMGAVYKANDPRGKEVVALKILPSEIAAKKNMIERFRREARAAAFLKHENIVDIREFGEIDGTFYLALEFVDGKDLHDYIARSPGRRLGVEEARQITMQIARALDHAHHADIVHRDIKPSNVLIVQRPDGPLAKITDLGLARMLKIAEDEEHEKRVTKVGSTLGTVDYMAPEQARDSSKADIRSDLYALGCTLFHMLAGKPPFPKGTLAEKIVLHMESEPPDLCVINAAVPATLGLMVRRMMAKNPRDRYQTPAELLADLENPDQVRPFQETPLEKKPRKAAERPVPEVVEARKPSSSAIAARRKNKKAKAASWLPLAIGGGAALVLGIIVLIIVSSLRPPAEKSAPEEIKQTLPKVEPVTKPPPPKVDIVGPPVPALKPLYQPVLPLDIEALTKEHFGSFAAFPEPPAEAKTIVVRRMPIAGQASVATMAEALASAQGASVIEFHDQGPHYLSSLPPQKQRRLWIRGGAGFRPLLAWDGGGGPNLVSLERGQLVLDNLDVVAFIPDKQVAEPLCLFQVRDGDFQARACTFSVAGKHAGGVIVARVLGADASAAASGADAELKCRFSRCLARGHDLTLLATQNTAADVLIDGTLAVTGTQPLLLHRHRDEDNLSVRMVRSTLVAQQQLWRWQSAAGKSDAPRIKVMAWDTIFARSETPAGEGEMFHLADGARTSLMGFNAVNCLYAGWRSLLTSGDKNSDTLSDWRLRWGHREGDLALAETWPPRPLGPLEEVPPTSLATFETAAGFAASAGPAPLGCEIGRLPPEPTLWKQRTFEKYVVADLTLPEADVPEIPTSPEGLYHGERIELGKIDLGLHVQARLQTLKPGPRIVLRLAGKGAQATTPIRFRGAEQIVIYFEQPAAGAKEKVDPLTLELKPGSVAPAIIDVEGGALEIHHGRFRFENSRIAAMPPHVIRVRGGDLRLQRCTITGPLSKAPDSFQSLIACHGSGIGGAQPVHVSVRDCVLQGGKPLIELKNPGIHLRCRGSLLYGLGDALVVDLSTSPISRTDVIASFDNNTIAQRQAFATLRAHDAPTNCRPVVLQMQANYFLDPFADEPRQACLVKLSADALARGLFLWQGKGNLFARDRLQAYYAAADMPVVKQSFKEWEKLLGPLGETGALHIDALAAKGLTPDNPPYDRLVVPPTVRLEPMPGADLAKLGVVKKK